MGKGNAGLNGRPVSIFISISTTYKLNGRMRSKLIKHTIRQRE